MKIKNLLTTLTLVAIFLFVGKVGWGQTAGDYRSATTGNWSATSTWEIYDGSNWIAATVIPSSADGLITVLTGHSVTIDAALTVDQLVVQSGATVVINANIILADGAGTDLIVDGTVINTTGTTTWTGQSQYNSGSKYQHNRTMASAVPVPTATWDANSTVEISGHTTGATYGLGQIFGNFTWNVPTQSGNIGLGNSILGIQGNLTVTSTGNLTNRAIRLTASTAYTLTVNGNLILNGGNLGLSSGTGTSALTVKGNVVMSGNGAWNSEFYFNQSSTGVGTLNVEGDVTIGAGCLVTEVGAGTAHVLSFTKAGTQNFTNNGTISNDINFSVGSTSVLVANSNIPVVTGRNLTINGVLDLMTNQVTGSGNLTLAADATLKTAHVDGVNGSIAVTGTKTLNANSSFEFNGTSAQVTGSLLPSSVKNLTINNANGVSLSANTSVTGTLTFTNGKLDIGNFDLNIASTGSIVGNDASKYVLTSGAGYLKMPTSVSTVTYPIGTATAFTSPTFTGNTSTDVVGVRVKNTFSHATLANDKCVNLEFTLTEATLGGNDGTTCNLYWNASSEGASFVRTSPVKLGVWNASISNYESLDVAVTTTSEPYYASIPLIGAEFEDVSIVLGNVEAFPLEAPSLTSDATSNNVDNNIEITFTDDATWRGKITSIWDGVTEIPNSDYTIAANLITLTPKASNSLKNAGTRTIKVVATGYIDATVNQDIYAGSVSAAKSTATINTPLLLGGTSTIKFAAKDQFENPRAGYIGQFDVTVKNDNATTAETYVIKGSDYTSSAIDMDLSMTDGVGEVTFDVVIPALMDALDGVAIQVTTGGGENVGTPFTYYATASPQVIIPTTALDEHLLNNKVVAVTLSNTDFIDPTLDIANFALNNAPAGLSISEVTYTDSKHADVKLAYADLTNDFDVDVNNVNITIKAAELACGTDLTSNSVNIAAQSETAPVVTTNDAIGANGVSTATWGGNVTGDAAVEPVTEKGLCWGTATSPTIAGNRTIEGAGLGSITGSMSGLSANTLYYVKAYVTNFDGTLYGAEKTFRTLSEEPTNHVTAFAVAASTTNLVLTWTNNDGAVAPTHYLIKASTSDNITDPVDGAAVPAEKLAIGDNDGVKVVTATEATYTWPGLTAGTKYYFKIYPFTKNDVDNLPNYKTATVPTANATVNSNLNVITATTIGTLGATSITNIPASTTVSALKTAITVSPNATKDILVAAGGASAADTDVITNTMVVKVTAQDGTVRSYTLELQVVSSLFYDGFTGTGNIGGACADATCTNNGWNTHSNSKVGTINIVSESLNYSGLMASIGGKVLLPGSNADVPRDVSAPISVAGNVAYYSALINVVDNTQLTSVFDYFIHFGTSTGTTTSGAYTAGSFIGKVGAKAVGTSAPYSTTEFQLGLASGTGSGVTYTDWTANLSFGTTYLVVVMVDVSTTPVTAKLWVNPSSLGGAEPSGSITNSSGATSVSTIKSICLRNASSPSPASGTPKVHVDEIRVGTTFAEVTPLGSTDPTTSVSVATLPDFGSMVINTSSPEASFTVSGSNLTNNVVVTAPAGFEISTVTGAGFTNTNPITLAPTAGSVNASIYVKFRPTAAQAYTGNITVVSTGVATDKAVAVTGTGVTSDTEAPVFATDYPKAANIGVDKFDVVVKVNELGKVWFLNLASGATAPTVAEVKAGTLINVTAANTDFSSPVTGLTSNTSYDVYFVTEDNQAVPNTLATPVKLSVTTTSIPLVTIHDIQYTTATPADSPYKGQQITTKGLVVAVKPETTGASFYMQNGSGAWNGVYVYKSSTSVTVGDSVTFTAFVDEYNGLTELKTITNLTILNSGNAIPAAPVVSLADAGTEAYEGVLVKVVNAECTVLPNSNKEWTVSDGTNNLLVNDYLYDYTPTQGTRYNITGVIDYAFSAFKLNPRSASDVTLTTSTPETPFASFKVYPNPFVNEIRFEGANVERVVITSIIGQVVMDKSVQGENFINTNELVRGIYLVKFSNNKGESVLRKLIKE